MSDVEGQLACVQLEHILLLCVVWVYTDSYRKYVMLWMFIVVLSPSVVHCNDLLLTIVTVLSSCVSSRLKYG